MIEKTPFAVDGSKQGPFCYHHGLWELGILPRGKIPCLPVLDDRRDKGIMHTWVHVESCAFAQFVHSFVVPCVLLRYAPLWIARVLKIEILSLNKRKTTDDQQSSPQAQTNPI